MGSCALRSNSVLSVLRYLTVFGIVLIRFQIRATSGQKISGNRLALISGEFCERESFEASCSSDEVILMRTALYGRMKYGKCVQTEYGSMGCSADVLQMVDSWCSGRRQCRFPITDLYSAQPCPRELIAYLETSYECVTVSQCPEKSCTSGGTKLVASTSGEGFLASSVTSASGCGSFSCPWVIQVKPGQRVNMTFFSFLIIDEIQQQSKLCQRLAVVTDPATHLSKDVTVCSRDTRVISHVTSGDTVHVKLYPGNLQKSANFVVQYHAVGCPNYEAPPGGWVKRDGNLLTVGCSDEQRTWHLTCDGVTWVGDVSSCDTLGPTPSWNVQSALGRAKSTTEGILMVVGLGVFIGVVTGCSMLAVVIVIIKRRRRKMALQFDRRREPQYSDDGAAVLDDQLYTRKQICGDKELPVSEAQLGYDRPEYDRTPYDSRVGFSYLCTSHAGAANPRFRQQDVTAQLMALGPNVCTAVPGNNIAEFGKDHAYETPNFST